MNEVPYGRAYKTWDQEFGDTLLRITRLGLGLIVIAHAEIKTVTEKDDQNRDIEYETVRPALDHRAVKIINPLVDIIGYIALDWDEEGNAVRTLYTRATPTVLAGSRFKYLPDKIPFGYEELQYAVTQAILKGKEKTGTLLPTK